MKRWLQIGALQLAVCLLPVAVYLVPGLASSIEPGESARQAVAYVPAALLLAVGFLGWKLNQTRILWACLLQLGSWAALRRPDAPPLNTILGTHAAEVIPICLPLSLSLVFLIRECPLFASRSVERAGAALAPLLLLVWMVNWAPESYDALVAWKIATLGDRVAFPHAAIVSVAAFALVAVLNPDARIRGFLMSQVFTLIPALFAARLDLVAAGKQDAFRTDLAFVAVSLVLLHAMFTMYWSRVYLDELTGIPNRRALNDRLHAVAGEYSLAMIDIDHFKDFNDEFGHAEGDNILRLVAGHLGAAFGPAAYRYGGEEFCVVIEGPDPAKAVEAIDRARIGLARREFHIRSDQPRRKGDRGRIPEPGDPAHRIMNITFSAGVTATREDDAEPEAVIRRADAALYRAKNAGRNRVVTD